jgi:DNA-binding GntR family transcriptional regulator
MRQNLAQEVADVIRRRIARGELASGERLSEGALAAGLEVSRTPLREALARLTSEGLVRADPRRGFFVQTLEPEEIESLYQVRAILDPAVLDLAGAPSGAQRRRLRALNDRIASFAGDPAEVVDLDNEWHRELLSHCPNAILLELIDRFMLRTEPFERAYFAAEGTVDRVASEHAAILAALGSGDLASAVTALRANMTSAIPVLVEWAREGGWER